MNLEPTSSEVSEISWKQSVAQIVFSIVEDSGANQFAIEQVYAFQSALQLRFPGNKHVREKTRQSLQKLVGDGILVRSQRGVYSLNIASPEVKVERPLPIGSMVPGLVENKVRVRLRNTLLAIEIKRRYNDTCQICGVPVPLCPPRFFAEGHHLKPLGNGHEGPDVAENIIVLCPNHHVMFDAGAAAIEPDTARVVHLKAGVFDSRCRLQVADWHYIAPEYVSYHYGQIFQNGVFNNLA